MLGTSIEGHLVGCLVQVWRANICWWDAGYNHEGHLVGCLPSSTIMEGHLVEIEFHLLHISIDTITLTMKWMLP